MSNNSDGDKTRDHLKRTASTPRLRHFRPLIVTEVKDLSSTVKGITFRASRHYLQDLNFKAGQWVDMLIPGVKTVGGFSICNSPFDLMKNKRLVLAVKNSDHPPAHWCNTKCKVGDRVEVRVGGTCFYECHTKDNPAQCRPLLLIGGGVGVNPLLSIFMYRRDMFQGDPVRTHMVLTARTKSELLFETEIVDVCKSNPYFSYRFHVTQEPHQNQSTPNSNDKYYSQRRFTLDDLKASIDLLTEDSILPDCYICGPPPFIEWVAKQAREAGLSEESIRYEKWW